MTRSTLLTNVRLVDLAAGRVQQKGWLRIVDGRIAALGAGETPAGESLVVDLGGAFLLPGLWDVHSHLSFERPVPRNETTAERTLRCIQAAIGAGRAGITGIRSAGESAYIDCAARDFFRTSSVSGPRVVPAGYFLTTTAGHITDNPVALALDGAVAFRKAVRNNIRHGAEVIKINMSGGIWGPAWDTIEDVFQAEDEIEAVFAIAHQRGLPVMAHAAGARSTKLAVKWGARSIEHGYALDEEAVEAMARAGTVFVPTLAMSQLSAGLAHDQYEKAYLSGNQIPPAILEKALSVAERAAWGFRQALAAGITIACGSDTNPLSEGAKLELAWLVRLGMTPREALLAATRTAADLCGHGADTGTIAIGKAADLLAVEGDPLEDIYAVRRVRAVWRQGVRLT